MEIPNLQFLGALAGLVILGLFAINAYFRSLGKKRIEAQEIRLAGAESTARWDGYFNLNFKEIKDLAERNIALSERILEILKKLES